MDSNPGFDAKNEPPPGTDWRGSFNELEILFKRSGCKHYLFDPLSGPFRSEFGQKTENSLAEQLSHNSPAHLFSHSPVHHLHTPLSYRAELGHLPLL